MSKRFIGYINIIHNQSKTLCFLRCSFPVYWRRNIVSITSVFEGDSVPNEKSWASDFHSFIDNVLKKSTLLNWDIKCKQKSNIFNIYFLRLQLSIYLV